MKYQTNEQITNAIIEAQRKRSIKCPNCGGWQVEERSCFEQTYHRFRCTGRCGQIEDAFDKDMRAVNLLLGVTPSNNEARK